MLTRIIVTSYGAIVELALWGFLFGGTYLGYRLGSMFHDRNGEFVGIALGFIATFLIEAVVFGAVLILDDIRNVVRSIENLIREKASAN